MQPCTSPIGSSALWDEGQLVELREKNQRAQLVLDQLLEARPGAHWHDEESRGRLRRHRQVCNRRHRKAHRAHFLNATAAKQKELFGRALNGGPFRHLFVARVVTNPPHLIEPSTRGSDDERLVHKAQDKLRTWSDCFSSLLSTPEPPIADKWWMDSATSHRARQAAAADPFEWPQLMRTEDLRRVLGRGIPRPAPGPDGWEKWIFRQADIGFLGLVTAIANYCLRTSYFPDHLRQNHLMPVHKRGDVTERSNYRGVTHANCLYQASMAWYTSRLQEYIWRRRLISPTQVVGKQGVQPGDLMQFLEQLDTAARLNGQTVHILKRDHIKGFDNLHPSAIEDALTFFGFPRSVVEFEKARTANTSLFVKTQDGIATQPIMTDGQTKQGDPASPLKYALAMSILPACLSVVPGLAEAAATVRTVNGRHDTINVPADRVALTVPIVEAMDDSLLLASSENDLGGLLEVPGAFQRALWGPNSVEQSWEDPSKTSFAPPPRPTWAAALKELTTAEEPTRHASSGSTKTTSINGPPARTSIDICVFGLPHHHQDSAINHVESAIVSLPSLKLEALVLSIGDPGAPQNVPQSTVTIKWAPRKWLQPDLDLASELDDVRKALLSDGRLPSWLPAA